MLELMERLLNNNESEYFYLRREPAIGLDSDYCALLQLSVPLKSELHYQTLLEAKIAQLSESFEHKLAYLLGTIYGRIATEDWFPNYASEAEFENLKKEAIEPLAAWIPTEAHAKVITRLKRLRREELTVDQLDNVSKDVAAEREGKLTEVLDEIGAVLAQLGLEEGLIVTARKHLKNKTAFAARIR